MASLAQKPRWLIIDERDAKLREKAQKIEEMDLGSHVRPSSPYKASVFHPQSTRPKIKDGRDLAGKFWPLGKHCWVIEVSQVSQLTNASKHTILSVLWAYLTVDIKKLDQIATIRMFLCGGKLVPHDPLSSRKAEGCVWLAPALTSAPFRAPEWNISSLV